MKEQAIRLPNVEPVGIETNSQIWKKGKSMSEQLKEERDKLFPKNKMSEPPPWKEVGYEKGKDTATDAKNLAVNDVKNALERINKGVKIENRTLEEVAVVAAELGMAVRPEHLQIVKPISEKKVKLEIEDNALYDMKQASKFLNIPEITLWYWVKQGKFKAAKMYNKKHGVRHKKFRYVFLGSSLKLIKKEIYSSRLIHKKYNYNC